MIVEGILTTLGADGRVHMAPMGPRVDDDSSGAPPWRRLVLRPFRTSTTYQNLRRLGAAVFHVIDDVELLARAAIGPLDPPPPLAATPGCPVPRLADACHWHALEVDSIDDREERATILARVVGSGSVREFVGLNRAKHAVVEAAILATRVNLLEAASIASKFAELKPLIDKTGGPAERRAFALLEEYVARGTASRSIELWAPSRLHFGMFSFGHARARQFGGVGAMIDTPGLGLRGSPAERFEAAGPLADRVVVFAERVGRAWGLPGAASKTRSALGARNACGTRRGHAVGPCRGFGFGETRGTRGGRRASWPPGSRAANDRRWAPMDSPWAD